MLMDPCGNGFTERVKRTTGRLRRVSRTLQCCGWTLAVVAFSGCGGDRGPPRTIISGSVTYQGKPVESGEIRFIPTKGSTGPLSVAPIVRGKYRADHRGGVVVGAEQVEIYAYRPNPQSNNQPGNLGQPGVGIAQGRTPGEQYLPAKYNTQSQLEITIERGSGEITRDFILTN